MQSFFLVATLFAGLSLAATSSSDLFTAVNARRARHGAPPLCRSSKLDFVAQKQATDSSKCGGTSCCLTQPCDDASVFAAVGFTYQKHAKLEIQGNLGLESVHSMDSMLLDTDFTVAGIAVVASGNLEYMVVVLAIPGILEPACGVQGTNHVDLEAEVHALINQERTKYGLDRLCRNKQLELAAQHHSQDQAQCGVMSHNCCSRSPSCDQVSERVKAVGYQYRKVGENVADAVFGADVVVKAWMDSPGHRKNILTPEFTNTGIALHSKDGKLFWTQLFGVPSTGQVGCSYHSSSSSPSVSTSSSSPSSTLSLPSPTASGCHSATALCDCIEAKCGTEWGWSRQSEQCMRGSTTEASEVANCPTSSFSSSPSFPSLTATTLATASAASFPTSSSPKPISVTTTAFTLGTTRSGATSSTPASTTTTTTTAALPRRSNRGNRAQNNAASTTSPFPSTSASAFVAKRRRSSRVG